MTIINDVVRPTSSAHGSGDTAHVMPALNPAGGGMYVVNFNKHANPGDLENWAVTTDTTATVRTDFLIALGAAIASVVATPITVEPDPAASANHVRAIVDVATVGGRAKIVLTIQSRPAHAVLSTYNLDVACGYAARIAAALVVLQ